MIDAPLALAFSAGLVATVNPCGFAMLPAYLSYFMGLEDPAAADRGAPVARGLLVGAVVSAGFLAVFATAGVVVSAGLRSVMDYVPWLAIAIGAALVVLGVALLLGHHVRLSLPRLERGGGSRQLSSLFVFGISYAVASLSCTLPVFLAVVAGTLTQASFLAGVATLVAYGLGMTLVLVTLTLALALAKHSLVRRLRAAMAHVNRAAGMLLVLAGIYIVYYWVFNLTTRPGTTTGSAPARFVERLSGKANTWITDAGAALPMALAAVLAVALAIALIRTRRAGAAKPAPGSTTPPGDGVAAAPPVVGETDPTTTEADRSTKRERVV